MTAGNRKRAADEASSPSRLERLAAWLRRRRPRPNRLVPRERRRSRTSPGYLLLFAVVVVAVASAFVFHLHVRFEGHRLAREARKARVVKEQLIRERAKLRLELASLKAPHRVENEARDRLGMEVPDHQRIIPISRRRKAAPASGGAF